MGLFSEIFKKKLYKDPVCGMATADTISTVYNTKNYYFCSEHCKEQFEADPEAHLAK